MVKSSPKRGSMCRVVFPLASTNTTAGVEKTSKCKGSSAKIRQIDEVFYGGAGPGDRRGFCFTNWPRGGPEPKLHIAAGHGANVKGVAVY
jgi:hypothetical protein